MRPLDRRQAISAGVAMAVVGVPSKVLAAPAHIAAGTRIRLGVASYTFRSFDSQHVIEFMKQLRCANLNVKDVHLPQVPSADVAGRAAEFGAAGLTLTSAGNITFPKVDRASVQAKFDYCKAAGVALMICAPPAALLPLLQEFVRRYDIRLAIHNHGPEDKHFPSPLDVLAAVKDLDPRIGCCIDVGHTMRTETDVPAAIRSAGPRLFDVHMKDLANAAQKESQVAVGEGIMPVRDIFQALLDVGYTGFVDLEYEIMPTDPMPGVLESFAYMRGVLSGMGHADWGFGG